MTINKSFDRYTEAKKLREKEMADKIQSLKDRADILQKTYLNDDDRYAINTLLREIVFGNYTTDDFGFWNEELEAMEMKYKIKK